MNSTTTTTANTITTEPPRLSRREKLILDIIRASGQRGVTRLDLSFTAGTGAALCAPQAIARLRAKGLPIETLMETGHDRDGRATAYARYRLGQGAAE